jgi:hypothetical protein
LTIREVLPAKFVDDGELVEVGEIIHHERGTMATADFEKGDLIIGLPLESGLDFDADPWEVVRRYLVVGRLLSKTDDEVFILDDDLGVPRALRIADEVIEARRGGVYDEPDDDAIISQ